MTTFTTPEKIAAEKLAEKKVLADIVAKIQAHVPSLRITPYSVGIMKATVRGGWVDAGDEWGFYSSKPFPEETRQAIEESVPSDVQVSSGSIYFPSSYTL